ncbi:helix-turn-helix domain-containing protein [Streptomyces sp. NBC_01304]|uniref:helix-turn-helix domain-containing protein n=1 Tax=Streptomyces sp. NBC_01304 TaxID=2903818 RepID=UPI002E0F2A42|nr:hypothetical protein OG430_44910 [Streptomyces sp. NBC_01304]
MTDWAVRRQTLNEQALAAELRYRYERGATLVELAEQLHVSTQPVRRLLKLAGTPMRPPGRHSRVELLVSRLEQQ